MTAYLFALTVMLSPQLDGGVRLGGGVITEAAALKTTPWFAVRTSETTVALQAPMLIKLESGLLRRRDWDEPGDYSKVLRRVEVGSWLKAGALRDRTIGNGTIVRRYHNGSDPDHGRLGIDVTVDLARFGVNHLVPNHLEVFVDQVFGPPVLGSAFGYRSRDNFALMTLAADLAAPEGHFGELNSVYTPSARRGARWISGLAGHVRATPHGQALTLDVHGDLNTIDLSAFGGHFGIKLGYDDRGLWRFTGRLEGMILGEGYTWGLFDQGYLIDRWTGLNQRLDTADFSLGGRVDLQLGYANAFILGGQFAQCSQAGRADLSAFLRVPLKRTTLTAFWRVRGPKETIRLFDFGSAMSAISVDIEITSLVSAELMMSRDWRTDINEDVFEPTTTGMVSLALDWSRN
jgi:hypothetical protein